MWSLFFETITKNTQNVVLPKGLDISHKTNLNETDRLTREEYDPTFYAAGCDKVQAAIPTIQKALEALSQFQDAWVFKLEKNYSIVLTRYGTGGSYDIKTREIKMRTTKSGEFARPNPAATPIHEITHLCVEHLVEKHGLSFSEKERLVKGIDSALFPEIFDPVNEISESDRYNMLDTLLNLPEFLTQRQIVTKNEPPSIEKYGKTGEQGPITETVLKLCETISGGGSQVITKEV